MVGELAQLAGDSGDAPTQYWISNSFRFTRSLHSNFYKDRDTANEVLDGLILCEELSHRLYDLFWPADPNKGRQVYRCDDCQRYYTPDAAYHRPSAADRERVVAMYQEGGSLRAVGWAGFSG